MRRIIIFTTLLFCFTTVALAQTDCEALVRAALDTADSACSATNRNQACYGNITLSAASRDGTADFRFEQAGDIANIADLQSLKLSSLSLTDETWGVALLKLQANLPDTLPGQNVTFLLFGDVNLTDASAEIVELPVTATSGVNVRLRPSTDASVLMSLRSGQEVTATGQLADGSWIRVRLDDNTSGWVSADFLDGDLNRLLPAEPGAPNFGPMQAFYFTTGYNDRPCAEAPDSGILIQTPDGAGTIQLRANNVQIELGSTVYLQAVPGDALYVNVIEGHATLTAQGESQVVPAGTVATVPLDSSGIASAPPAFPVTYDRAALQALPLDTALPETVTVEAGVAETKIPGAIDIANGLPPIQGRWLHRETVTYSGCVVPGQTSPAVGTVGTNNPTIEFSADRSSFTLPIPLTVVMYKTGENSYAGSFNVATWEVTFTSPTTYVGTWYNGAKGDPCTLTADVFGEYQS